MADKGSEGAGRHVAGGDAGDGPVREGAVAVDGDVNGCVSRPPFLIGVAGGTASGKSSVCKKIIEALERNSSNKNIRQHIESISQDCFYKELNDQQRQLAIKGQLNFDHPDALDEKQMTDTLRSIKAGRSVKVSEYDFVSHSPNFRPERTVLPADVILFEGILVFYFKEILEMFDLKLFVDMDADMRLARRVERDMKNRGRQLEQILHQYMTYVKPAFEEFCLPTKKYADIIIPRGADNTVAIDLIVQHILDLVRQDRSVPPDVTHPSTKSTVTRLH